MVLLVPASNSYTEKTRATTSERRLLLHKKNREKEGEREREDLTSGWLRHTYALDR